MIKELCKGCAFCVLCGVMIIISAFLDNHGFPIISKFIGIGSMLIILSMIVTASEIKD